jgi:PAS domain S-box-containing protein
MVQDIRKEPKNFFEQIVGSREYFTMEHRCLNGLCFLGFSFLLICALINFFISLPAEFILGTFLGGIIFGVLYYFCRFKKIFKPVYWLVLIVSCVLVCLTWLNAGGISGPFALIALMIVSVVNLISREKELFLSVIIIVFAVGLLFLLEFNNPMLTISYQSSSTKYIDNYATFLLAVLTVCFIINFALTHYRAERKKSEEATKQLKASEAHFRLLVENAPDAIFIQTEGCFKYVNPAALKFFGAETPQELIGKPIINRLHPDQREAFKKRIQILNKGKTPIPRQEESYLRVDGSPAYVEISAVPFEYQDKDGSLVFVRDVSEQKKAVLRQKETEKRLQQAQKMESLGLLAGGVAHDLNNILSGIVSYPDLLLIDLPEDSPLKKPIVTIKNSGLKAADIVQDLLTLARRGVSTAEVVNLNDIIEDYLRSPEYQQLVNF